MQRVGLAFVFATLACTRVNPAFELSLGVDDSGQTSVFDGDTGASDDASEAENTGDGDHDSDDGDSGDGDSVDDTGDGDTGDGDSVDDTGDGDTGDGDGDPACNPEPDGQDHPPFLIASLGWIDTSTAPNFAEAFENCHLMVICTVDAEVCDGVAPYLAKAYSSGDVVSGTGLVQDSAIQMRFQAGGGECGATDALNLDPEQFIGLSYWNGQAEALIKVRLPCLEDYDLPIYIDVDGSTYWNPQLTEPAAIWP